jgi:hypothetical protein
MTREFCRYDVLSAVWAACAARAAVYNSYRSVASTPAAVITVHDGAIFDDVL